MASKIGKKFKRLRDIWLILTKEEWYLHDDFFPHTEEVARAASAPAAPAPAAPARAASAPAAPAPESSATNSSNLTRLERNQIEVLRAEWRAFPSMRHAIEERMAEFGIVLEPT